MALAKCSRSCGAWAAKKHNLTLHAVLGEDGRVLDDADDAGHCLREHWSRIFHARKEVAQDVNPKDVMRHVVRAPDDIVWTMSEEDFCTMLARKRELAPSQDGLPYIIYRCAGGIEAKLLFKTYGTLVAGGRPPDGCTASRTVFIPRSCEVHEQGRIVGSPGALLPLTLCNCVCKVITTATDSTAVSPGVSTPRGGASADVI